MAEKRKTKHLSMTDWNNKEEALEKIRSYSFSRYDFLEWPNNLKEDREQYSNKLSIRKK